MDEKQVYQLVITDSAERAYFELLNYIYEHHSINRADKIAIELLDYPRILKDFPNLGSKEPILKDRTKNYKFILYKRTPKATVKIIYYVDEEYKTIFLTDFFPCEKFEKKMKRNK